MQLGAMATTRLEISLTLETSVAFGLGKVQLASRPKEGSIGRTKTSGLSVPADLTMTGIWGVEQAFQQEDAEKVIHRGKFVLTAKIGLCAEPLRMTSPFSGDFLA
ncbi:hypothetical protein McanMca71_004836 [Microsporum canis]